ncbi:hypothetical protein [Bacillus toyonensis]
MKVTCPTVNSTFHNHEIVSATLFSTDLLHTIKEDLLHTIKAVDGRDFIVSGGEVSSLLKRITTQGATPSLESLNFYNDLILVPRFKLNRFRKRYKTLQVLRETDMYVWLVRNEIFKETVEYEPSLWNHKTTLDELEEDILSGNLGSLSNRMVNQLVK